MTRSEIKRIYEGYFSTLHHRLLYAFLDVFITIAKI
jgi:hypothetical protein